MNEASLYKHINCIYQQIHIKLTSFQSIPTNQTQNSSTAKWCSQVRNGNNV